MRCHEWWGNKVTAMDWADMKKTVLFVLTITAGITTYGQLHGIRLNGYSAYVFDNRFDTYNTSNQYLRGKIKGGFQWGVGLEFLPHDDYGIELLYYRQDTKAPISYDYGNGLENREVDLGINYFMAGGMRYLNTTGGKLQPYGGLLIGVVALSNKEPQGLEESRDFKFGWGIRLGVNVRANEMVAIKLQAQILSAVQGFDGGLYLSTGGAEAGVSTYPTLYQFVLGGGLRIKIDKNE